MARSFMMFHVAKLHSCIIQKASRLCFQVRHNGVHSLTHIDLNEKSLASKNKHYFAPSALLPIFNSSAWQTATKQAKETWCKKAMRGSTAYFGRGHSLFLEGAVLILETTVLTLQKQSFVICKITSALHRLNEPLRIKPDEQVHGSVPHDITVWYFVVVKVRCIVPRLRQWPCTHSSNTTAWQTATKRAKETWWKKTTSLGGGTPYFWRGHSLFLEGAVLIFETTVLTLQK